jgi:peptidoglycan/LPS O-acetylase OafA/YrhL
LTTVESPRLGYRPGLDGLRAVAVLLVLVFHVAQPHRFAGFIGVDVFFTLSGFLITTILVREIDRTRAIAFGRFYIRRFLRLYPALIVMLIVWTPAFTWIVPSATPAIAAKDALVAATYTSNIYMTWRGTWLGPFTHTWSLALEEQYYLIWPVVLLLVLRRTRRETLAVICFAAALVAAILTVHDFRYGAATYPLQSTSLGLLCGSALALAAGMRPVRAMRGAAGASTGVALLVLELVAFSLTTAVPSGVYVVVSVVASSFLVASNGIGSGDHWVGRLLTLRWLRDLGRISYGVYLWHYPVTLAAERGLASWTPIERFPLVAVISIGVAAVSFRYVESPFLRLKDRFEPTVQADTKDRAPAQDVSG